MKNLSEHRCPECGNAFDPNDSDSFLTEVQVAVEEVTSEAKWFWMGLVVVACLVLLYLVSVARA